MAKTCFVIMAIGDTTNDGAVISSADLKSKYDHLIKEAILKARPLLEVVRADEVAIPGTITTDIITRIMHSDYVVADVTYPNPNVFYELGLRHACRSGTIIIKDKDGPKVPFDIAHLRYIEYENTTPGLKALSEKLATYFNHLDRNPGSPDNHFQEYAKLTGYLFPNYSKEEKESPELEAMLGLMQSPELMHLIARQTSGEDVSQFEIFQALANNPAVAQPLFQALVKSGEISFSSNDSSTKKLPAKKK